MIYLFVWTCMVDVDKCVNWSDITHLIFKYSDWKFLPTNKLLSFWNSFVLISLCELLIKLYYCLFYVFPENLKYKIHFHFIPTSALKICWHTRSFFIRILFIRIIRLKSEKSKNYLRIMFRLRSCCGLFKSYFSQIFLYIY